MNPRTPGLPNTGSFFPIVLVLLLSACHKLDQGARMTSQHPTELAINNEFAKVKTVCFGRFVVEVPADAEVAYGRVELNASIDFFPEKASALEDFLAKEVAEVEDARRFLAYDKANFPRYGEVIDGPVPDQRTVLGSLDQVTYSVTSFVPKESHLYVLSLKYANDVDAKIALTNRIAASLRPREANDIPAEPGFCTEGGFIPMTTEYENSGIGFRFKGFPDVHFSINTRKNQDYLPQGGMVEERMASAAKDASVMERLWLARIDFLRRGKRTLSAWTGEEVLARLPSQPGAKESHQFQFTSVGELNNSLVPEIDIELVSGVKKNERGGVPPSLSDQQMLALWDRLTSTIRARPTVAPSPAPAENKVKLGTPLMTGRLCPQTGWWECNDPGVLPGEKRKFIKEGDTIPYTVAAFERSLWDKLKGAPSVGRRAALWELAAYDDLAAPATAPNSNSIEPPTVQ